MKSLSLKLSARLSLKSPILAASGTCGWGDHSEDLVRDEGIGALITPTLTLEPREGNPMPRTAETTAGLLHSTGLPNPGLASFLAAKLPALARRPYPAIVSIYGDALASWRKLGATIGNHAEISAIELNLTPPWLLFSDVAKPRYQPEQEILSWMSEVIAAIREVTNMTLIAKLPPNVSDHGLAAKRAEEAGADVIAVAGAQPGIAVRLSSMQFRLPGAVGGLSGPCIKPIALYQVWQAAQATSLPIIGSGGIMTANDALEFFVVGASAVAVGIANTIHPSACSTIAKDLHYHLSTTKHTEFEEFVVQLRTNHTA